MIPVNLEGVSLIPSSEVINIVFRFLILFSQEEI